MKAIHKTFGEVEVLHRDATNVTTILHDGKNYRILPFVSMLFNADGSKFDISVLPVQELILVESRETSGQGRKTSKTAELIEGLAEMRGETWNSRTRRYEKIY